MNKHTDEQYLSAIDDLFDDGDADIRNYKRNIVKTRKEHPCMAADLVSKPAHDISAGSRSVRESALVDGEYGASYSCLECLDVWLDEFHAILSPQEAAADER